MEKKEGREVEKSERGSEKNEFVYTIAARRLVSFR